MPAPLIPKEEVLNRLTTAFRSGGYQGTSLKDLCEATGLVKASLYHYFPGGKEEMAQAVLDHVNTWVTANILGPLNRNTDPQKRIQHMVSALNRLYDKGRTSCLIALFSIGEASDPFRDSIHGAEKAWERAIVSTLLDAGIDKETAEYRAEQALIQIQGSLIIARAKRSPRVFTRTINNLPDLLLSKN